MSISQFLKLCWTCTYVTLHSRRLCQYDWGSRLPQLAQCSHKNFYKRKAVALESEKMWQQKWRSENRRGLRMLLCQPWRWKEATGQFMQAVSRSLKQLGNSFFPRSSRRNQANWQLDLRSLISRTVNTLILGHLTFLTVREKFVLC